MRMALQLLERKLHVGTKLGAMGEHITLNTGAKMPLIGLGTFQTKGEDIVHKTIESILKNGYRSIDTAGGYKNEADIGNSLKELLPKYDLTRKDLFITSKLPPKDQGYDNCRTSCMTSLENLQMEYLDLYLIHWPGTQKMKHDDVRNVQNRKESWMQMETLLKEGKLKSIGVSNYTLNHMEELLSFCTIKPAVLQIEHHPHLVQKELVEFCRDNDIHFQAYSSLGTMMEDNKLLNDPLVVEIANCYTKTPAQILLKWAVQQHIGVIPKSTNPVHIAANIDIFDFELSSLDLQRLTELDKQHHYCWNPITIV
ncbi:unnamed protein product [Owenia fusiformis]|uniref:Uncharacterized protein n=1 Tax=Owenia fusiformis TaxID=6347 RepID=A0A8J1T5L5_OWEFU|nr:unnamed protein product [Owenia fusiformis]